VSTPIAPSPAAVPDARGVGFSVVARLADADGGVGLGRAGVLHTPHGQIETPAFVPVGTKATVKALLPQTVADLGAQAVLANAYHLYLQPGPDIVDEAGGLGSFMGWAGPTFTDSGGFQVLSLGMGFKKVLAMDVTGRQVADVVAPAKSRLAQVDDDGVTFKSHLDGSMHRFTPEVSMRIQHQLGADVIFAFDECTTLVNTRQYQEQAVARTQAWAQRCVAEHGRQTEQRPHRPYQQLFAVVQGAQHEDLRRAAVRDLLALEPDGFGIGGALEKASLGTIVGWCCQEIPEHLPRHLLGIGEPEDVFTAVAAGIDTFDCVAPSRAGRTGTVYASTGKYNLVTAANRRAFEPLDPDCDCWTCRTVTRAYLHHLFKAKEMLAATLATIHNERFTVRLVERIRAGILTGDFAELRAEFLGRFTRRPA
jgi:queuine tRNA-ribosyltransferase